MRRKEPEMQINWTGIICLALVIFVIVTVVHAHNKIAAFLGTIGQIGPGNSSEDKILGLIAFALVVLLIVAIVKILVSRQG